MSGTFVVTGNLPNDFPSMVKFLSLNESTLPMPIVIQTLAPDLQIYAKERGWAVFDLLDKQRYLDCLQASELTLGHCGVGFLKDCLSLGRLGYFLPRRASEGEHIDDHQSELADLIKARGWGYIVPGIEKVHFDTQELMAPVELWLDFAGKLPSSGTFLMVSSIGGHYAESNRTIESLTAAGAYCIATIVDETAPFVSDVICVHSCRRRRGMPIALLQLLWLMLRLKPDFIVTHGAGVGFLGVLAARILGRPAYACESLTRVSRPGRWFAGAYRLGAQCFAPETAQFLNKPAYARVQSVRLQLKAWAGTGGGL